MANRLFTLLFAALLLLPGVVTLSALLAPGSNVDEVEARNLADAPPLAWAWSGCWSQFTHAADDYVSDHFGLRQPLLAANAHVRGLFATPATPDVVMGRDGWLFYAPGLVATDATAGPKAFARVAHQARMLEAMARYHRFRGEPFVVVIAPDKHTIYPEMLPAWARGRTSSAAYDRMLAELRQRGVAVVDVRDSLRAAKAQAPQYYRTDTHWTRPAARTAFNQALAAVGLPPVAEGPIEWSDSTATGYDLERMASLGGAMREFDVAAYPVVHEDKPMVEDFALPDGGQAYRATRPGAGPTTLVLGDSFSKESFKALALEVGPRLVWMQHRRCNFDPGTAAHEHADIVVYEIVERTLGCDARSADAVIAAFDSGNLKPRPVLEVAETAEDTQACPAVPEAAAGTGPKAIDR